MTSHEKLLKGGEDGPVVSVGEPEKSPLIASLVAGADPHMPSGISAPPAEVPEKDGELTCQLTAEATTNPARKEFSLVRRECDGTAEYPVRYSLAATSEDNGVPQGFSELVINSTDRLWLTVVAAAASQ